MQQPETGRPGADEYPGSYQSYLDLVPEGPILETLRRQMEATSLLLAGIPESSGGHRPAPGKWSVKEVVGHLIDTERVFAYRGLVFARGDRTPLPSFEQEDWVRASGSDQRTLRSLAEEYRLVRASHLALFGGLPAGAWLARGTASGQAFTARAIPWILAGHELHHLAILKDRYLRA